MKEKYMCALHEWVNEWMNDEFSPIVLRNITKNIWATIQVLLKFIKVKFINLVEFLIIQGNGEHEKIKTIYFNQIF